MTITLGKNGSQDLSDFVISATLSGNTAELMRTLKLNMQASDLGRKRTYNINVGDKLVFRYNDTLMIVAIVFETTINSAGQYTITAYDTNVYLQQSTDSRVFIRKKASDIVKILSKDYGIKLGTVSDTSYIIPRYMPANKSLSEMIFASLKLTRTQLGKRYFIGNKNGALTLYPVTQKTKYVFKSGMNLISAEYTRSIQDTKTQVKVVGGKKGKQTVVTAKNTPMIKKYGVLQAFEMMDEKATDSQVKQRATTMLKELARVDQTLSISTLGVTAVDVGTAVYVRNDMTKTDAAYYVGSITHNFDSANYTMDMELTRTLELPDITIDDDELKLPKEDK